MPVEIRGAWRALAVLACLLAVGAAAAGEDPGVEALPSPFLGPEGQVRLLVQPEFRDARSLAADLQAFGVEGLEIALVGPLVAAPDPRQPPVESRLLLQGAPEALARARQALAQLDRPEPSVVISLLAAEVRRRSRTERGASALFDRDGVPGSPNTLWRGLASTFDPDAYLRSTLTGAGPFQGTSVSFGFVGQKLEKYGDFDLVLRMLAAEGEAEFLAWPSLVLTEGSPGSIESLVYLPHAVIRESNPDGRVIQTQAEETGVELTATPLRVGSDAAVIDIEARLRFPDASPDTEVPAGTLDIRTRTVKTRVTLRDRETTVLGGLVLRRRLDGRRGVPVISSVPGVDHLTSARTRGTVETELLLVLRARIR